MKPRKMTRKTVMKRGGGMTEKKKTKMAMGGMTSGTMRPQNAMAGASVPPSQKSTTGMKRGGTTAKTKMMRGGATAKKTSMMRGGVASKVGKANGGMTKAKKK
jgi:hypothetical protein